MFQYVCRINTEWEKIFGNMNAKLIVMLSSSGSKVYAIYAVRLNESMAKSIKCRFGGQRLLAEAGTARFGSSAAVSLVTAISWHRKAKGTPRNHAHQPWFYFYLLAKEVPRQIHQCN